MSLDPMVWVIKDAPLRDVYELAVMIVLAEEATEDGRNALPSVSTLAERARCDRRQVQGILRELTARGVIGLGDQSKALYIRADRRPTVYDLLIPASNFSDTALARVNRRRALDGLPPITAANRPDIAPAPARPRRADAGKPRRRPHGVNGSHPVQGGTTGIQAQHGVNNSGLDGHLTSQVSGQVPRSRGEQHSPDPLTQRTNPPPPYPPHTAEAVASSPPSEEVEDYVEIDQVLLLAQEMGGAPVPRRVRAVRDRTTLRRLVRCALNLGWRTDELTEAIGGDLTSVRTVAGTLIHRLQPENLGAPPTLLTSLQPVPPQREPCPPRCEDGWVKVDHDQVDRLACPACKPIAARRQLAGAASRYAHIATFDDLVAHIEGRPRSTDMAGR
jgi:hypothetical protein